MIYLDSSALVTFVVRRQHADALDRFLAGTPSETCTSTVGLVETVRTCDQVGSYPNLMARLTREHREITVTTLVRDRAANMPGSLRALDTFHVASAEQFGEELKALVTYDRRMAEVARQRGLPVAMPGLE
jgi:predicted nucleic acid-binding protein